MGLTVSEKQHWKDRIGKRIEKKIEAIYAEDVNLHDRVQREARQRALLSLGLSEQQAELDDIEKQKDALEKREKRISHAMLAKIRGVPVEDLDDYFCYHRDSEVSSAVHRRQTVHEEELLAADERGQRVLQLREEKENLLDTVWLATSSKQIKDLWTRVAEILNDDQTPLQREALAIEPVSDD